MSNGGGGVPFIGAVTSTVELGLEGQKEPGVLLREGGIADTVREFTIAIIEDKLEASPGDQDLLDQLEALQTEITVFTPELILQALTEALDFGVLQSDALPGVFKKLAELLIDPTRTPGEPCLAPAPLLRDLLDLALGRAGGAFGEILSGVRETVEDFILPGFGGAQVLADSVQKVLEDPITAALNLILGQRGKIECETVGGVAVGVGVIERQIKRLEDALAEALP